MKNIISIVSPIVAFVLMICSVTFFVAVAYPFMTENAFKKYVLAHKNEIVKENLCLVIPTTKFSYYEYITLRLIDRSDSAYQIVFWGRRDSKLWDFKLDKEIIETIPYKRYKGKNVELDTQIYQLIKDNY